MAALRLLLDSVILIDHLNGIGAASRYLVAHAAEAAVSPITRAEVLSGYGSDEEAAPARRLIDRFPILPIGAEDADRAAQLRRESGWKLPDAFQAALALGHGLDLVTRDTRDFDPERHAFVRVPYALPGGSAA